MITDLFAYGYYQVDSAEDANVWYHAHTTDVHVAEEMIGTAVLHGEADPQHREYLSARIRQNAERRVPGPVKGQTIMVLATDLDIRSEDGQRVYWWRKLT